MMCVRLVVSAGVFAPVLALGACMMDTTPRAGAAEQGPGASGAIEVDAGAAASARVYGNGAAGSVGADVPEPSADTGAVGVAGAAPEGAAGAAGTEVSVAGSAGVDGASGVAATSGVEADAGAVAIGGEAGRAGSAAGASGQGHAGAAAIGGAGGGAGSHEPAELSATFEAVYALLEHDCAGCHASSWRAGGLNLKSADVAYASLVDARSSTCRGVARVTPGEPDASVLYLAISGARHGSCNPRNMPLGDYRWRADKVAAVKAWIVAGAPR